MKYMKLNNKAMEPSRGSKCAAGYDLYATTSYGSVLIPAGETVKVGTGIALEIPDGYFGAIFARSGLATKQGLRPANCVGIIDSDYRGEVIVPLYNDSQENKMVSDGDRIAQLVMIKYTAMPFEEVESLDETERGNCGFGSTGVSM